MGASCDAKAFCNLCTNSGVASCELYVWGFHGVAPPSKPPSSPLPPVAPPYRPPPLPPLPPLATSLQTIQQCSWSSPILRCSEGATGLAAIRCCALDSTPEEPVCGESVCLAGSSHRYPGLNPLIATQSNLVNAHTAAAECAAQGLRLCSLSEVSACCGSGCNLNEQPVWTSSACAPPSPTHITSGELWGREQKRPPLSPTPPPPAPLSPPPPPPPPLRPLMDLLKGPIGGWAGADGWGGRPPPTSDPSAVPSSSSPPVITDPAAAEEARAAVRGAATELNAILTTQASVDVGTAQDVTSFVSRLIEEEMAILDQVDAVGGIGGGGGAAGGAKGREIDAGTAKQITAAVMQLARAVTAHTEGEVVLTSSQLNLTAEARAPADLAAAPVRCEVGSELPTQATLPDDILDAIAGAGGDTSKSVSVVLFASKVNLHAPFAASPPPPPPSNQRRTESSVGTAADSGRNGTAEVTSSPLVSFTLLQDGNELRVQGAASRVNVSIPFASSLTSARSSRAQRMPPPCIGAPTNATDVECSMAIECRWWDAENGVADGESAESSAEGGFWSTTGCVTVASADGRSFTCSCNHLTVRRPPPVLPPPPQPPQPPPSPPPSCAP